MVAKTGSGENRMEGPEQPDGDVGTPPGHRMAEKRISVKWFALTGSAAAGAALYLEYLRTGAISPLACIITGVVLAALLLCMWFALKKHSSAPPSDRGPLFKSKRGAILIAVLMVCGAISFSTDFREALQKGRARGETARVREDVLKNARALQVGAGQPDSTGWVPATSSGGSFSVYVPTVFSEVCADLPDGKAFATVSKSKNAKFTVMLLRDSTLAKSIDVRSEQVSARMSRLGSGRVKIIEERFYDDRYPLFVLEVMTPEAEGLVQTILIDDGFYVLSVECREMTDAVRAEAQRFFESFKIIDEPNRPLDAE